MVEKVVEELVRQGLWFVEAADGSEGGVHGVVVDRAVTAGGVEHGRQDQPVLGGFGGVTAFHESDHVFVHAGGGGFADGQGSDSGFDLDGVGPGIAATRAVEVVFVDREGLSARWPRSLVSASQMSARADRRVEGFTVWLPGLVWIHSAAGGGPFALLLFWCGRCAAVCGRRRSCCGTAGALRSGRRRVAGSGVARQCRVSARDWTCGGHSIGSGAAATATPPAHGGLVGNAAVVAHQDPAPVRFPPC